ncbi:MAG: nucleotidyltransferase domain-containing protein [candidate division WOR-3 bacterium]|jgi:predicted nucleotidyltransferase
MKNKMLIKYNKKQDNIRSLFSREEVVIAYVFGSLVKNKISSLSDIDFAVYLDEDLSDKKKYNIYMELLNNLISVLGDKIDLVLMNSSELLMNFNIIREGKVIFERSETEKVLVESKIMNKYLDINYYHKRHVDIQLKRMEKAGLK